MKDFVSGLTRQEAEARLQAEGPNELPQAARRTPVRILLEVLREPMFALLTAAGAIYLLLGDLNEALLIIGFAGLSILITVIQENRTERVLETLRNLASPRATVIRDGAKQVIAGRDVVRGDLLLLGEGDRVPADCRLVEVRDLEADESLLTGESVPVRKAASDGSDRPAAQPGGDGVAFAFAGSMIVRGSARAEVIGTGLLSQIGRIGQSLKGMQGEAPRLQGEIRRLVRFSALGAALVTLLTITLYGFLRGGWLDALLAGIAIGMSMLPEEFPVIMTVFMAMGAWRISKARVLTRRAASIETLGAATVLCTDKTGTLTENRMKVAEMRVTAHLDCPLLPGAVAPDMMAAFDQVAEVAALASSPDPFDPMEQALQALARERALASGAERGWCLVTSLGLQPDLLAMTQVWQRPSGLPLAACKGAPEAIAELCCLKGDDLNMVRAAVGGMAEQGLRILGVANANLPEADVPEEQRQIRYTFLGLVGLSDPLRPEVPAAVAECGAAGIRVIMITGDYPETARAIGRKAGLDVQRVLTGNDIRHLGDEELMARIADTSVFARVMPEQKLRIVEALKAKGEIVAMTGDGVNDAPSLKAAHIGIAMGGRGTDVAREAASLVLLNDDFSSIVNAIRLGRRIYDNLRKAMTFIVAVHVPIAGLALLPLFMGLPVIFWPIHIAFIEMIVDPVCSLVFEAEVEERDAMRRSPRRTDAPLFTGRMIAWSLLQGVFALVTVALAYIISLEGGSSIGEARALAFTWLVASIVSLILVNRSFSTFFLGAFGRPNLSLAWVAAVVVGILLTALLWQPASELFMFGKLGLMQWAATAIYFPLLIMVLETFKYLFMHVNGTRNSA